MVNQLYIYLAEKDGRINTREGKINLIIKKLKQTNNPNLCLSSILKECGVREEELSEQEVKRIKKEVEYYFQKKGR